MILNDFIFGGPAGAVELPVIQNTVRSTRDHSTEGHR